MQTGKPKKLTAASLDEFPLIIAATPATKQERRVALAIILILTLVFIAIAPFASVQLPRVDAFVPALQTVLCVTDLITAALLFSLYSIQPLPGLLALASGYIFSGLFAFLQTLAFPGAYAPSGLIGDPLSSAPYLFFLWHIAFPLAVTVYALSDDRPRANDPAWQIDQSDNRHHYCMHARLNSRTDVGRHCRSAILTEPFCRSDPPSPHYELFRGPLSGF